MEESIQSLDGDDKSMWRVVKQFNNDVNEYAIQPLMDNDGNILSTDMEIADEFSKQYGDKEVVVDHERFKEVQIQAEEILRKCEIEGENDLINREISKSEIKKAIRKMRDNTG